ncbi:SDR family oxidoreductase [Lentilactobacillus senioris]|uniref:SDR family oxidoreductase n=1 Tax=Lentilactobacillus senioris TaxID=931534 RepID=UPI002280493B|nr:SDR family oxidoreductase [Lentilactobacillus senioris]MCY9806559.1 SDR family oxidoreductase [Lentilactobacillus senioris]
MARYDDLKGKEVLVTGAASGIGRAQVIAFLQQGANVTGLDIKKSDVVDPNYSSIRMDLRNTDSLETFIEQCKFDIVCNTAGILDDFLSVEGTDYSYFSDIMKVNLDAMFLISKGLIEQDKPVTFVNMSSYAGLFASGGGVSYTTSKHAINGLTKEIAFEYGGRGVRANAIAPCLVKTDMVRDDFESGLDYRLAKKTVFNRYAAPEEIADLTLFLASDSSKYITGQVISIDGGYSLGNEV